MTHGRAQRQTVTIGGSRDGTVAAYRLEILQDAGAYPRFGAFLPALTILMAPGPYAFGRAEAIATAVVTNTTPVGAYRGAGRPEATAAVERAIDLFAAEIGMDPAEVRRKNLLPKFTEPHTTAFGAVYDSGDYAAALDKALAAAGYADLREEQAKRRAAGDVVQLGIGISCYVEITGPGMEEGGPRENATVEVHPDGSATILTGTSPHGQGHVTVWAMLASDELGIPVDKITVKWGDTDLIPEGGGTGGSRSLQQGGAAVQQASQELLEVARQRAADTLEASPADLVFDAGRSAFAVAGDPAASVPLARLAEPERLFVRAVFSAPGPTFPFGAHIAVAEVDTETGKAVLRRMVTVDDAGAVINPLLAEGQRHGGIAQGAAQALCEEVIYDADGNPLTATFADYAVLSPTEVPSFELADMATPTSYNPLGAKGIGEAGTIGATPAVQNAVIDALAHLGVRHIDMPTTPQRVWQALRSAPGGQPGGRYGGAGGMAARRGRRGVMGAAPVERAVWERRALITGAPAGVGRRARRVSGSRPGRAGERAGGWRRASAWPADTRSRRRRASATPTAAGGDGKSGRPGPARRPPSERAANAGAGPARDGPGGGVALDRGRARCRRMARRGRCPRAQGSAVSPSTARRQTGAVAPRPGGEEARESGRGACSTCGSARARTLMTGVRPCTTTDHAAGDHA